MDDTTFQILKELDKHGIGITIDISPLFLKRYSGPDIDLNKKETVDHYCKLIERQIRSLVESNYINFEGYLKLGQPKVDDKLYWVDEVKLKASIRQEGVAAYDNELTRLDNLALNSSFRTLNEEIIPNNNRVQRKFNSITLIIAGLSFLAIAISAYYGSKSITAKEFLKIDSTLQNSTKLLDSTHKVQIKIDSSLLIMARTDSLRNAKIHSDASAKK